MDEKRSDSARYRVRAFELRDSEDVVELFLAPRCVAGTLQVPHQSRDDIRKKLANPPAAMHRLVAEEPKSGRVVGLIGLTRHEGRRSHVGDLGMFVHDDFQGRGVGKQLLAACIELADDWLGLERLELTVFVDNAAAIRLYETHGFQLEGTHRAYARRQGEYVDAHCMARLHGR